MARVLKKTLQARARRAGIKGYSKMTVAQLQKAIASAAKRKPKRKAAPKRASVKRSSTRRKPMAARGSSTRRKPMAEEGTLKKYDLRKFLQELEGEIKGDIMYGEMTSIYDIQGRIDDEIDREVTYDEDSALICIACDYYDWEYEGVYYPINSMPEAAYAALQEQVRRTGLKDRLEQYFEEQA